MSKFACAALGLLALASCAEFEALRDVPLEDGEVTFVVVHDRDGARTVRVVQREALSSLYLRSRDEAWVLTYRLTAAQMQLPLGTLARDPDAPRQLPGERRSLRMLGRRFQTAARPDMSDYRLPAFDAQACRESNGCSVISNGNLHCSWDCEMPIATPLPPQAPRFSAWSPGPDGAPLPPSVPANPCAVGQRFNVAVGGCVAIDACPDSNFRELPNGPALHVLAGAQGGDGSRDRPFGSVSDALRQNMYLPIKLGSGQYRLPSRWPEGRQDYRLVGRCASETAVYYESAFPPGAAFELSHASVSSLRTYRPMSFLGGSLRFVAVESRHSGVDAEESLIHIERSVVGGPSVPIDANRSQVRIVDSQVLGVGQQAMVVTHASGEVELTRSTITGLGSLSHNVEISTGSDCRVTMRGVRLRSGGVQVRTGRRSRVDILDLAVVSGWLGVESSSVALRGIFLEPQCSEMCPGLVLSWSDPYVDASATVEDAAVGGRFRVEGIGGLTIRRTRAEGLDVDVDRVEVEDVLCSGGSSSASQSSSIRAQGRVSRLFALGGGFSFACGEGRLEVDDVFIEGFASIYASENAAVELERGDAEQFDLNARFGRGHVVARDLRAQSREADGPWAVSLGGVVDVDGFVLEGHDAGFYVERLGSAQIRNGRLLGQEVGILLALGVDGLPQTENVDFGDVPRWVWVYE